MRGGFKSDVSTGLSAVATGGGAKSVLSVFKKVPSTEVVD